MAGSWGQIEYRGNDSYNGKQQSMFAVACTFTADASDASVPDLELTNISPALLADIGLVFDGTTPPDAVTFAIKDIDGLTVATATGVAASGRTALTNKPSVIGGCTVSISGNTTNSAKCKIILNFLSNRR